MNCQPTDPLYYWFQAAMNLLAAWTLSGLFLMGFGWLVSKLGSK